MRRMLRGTMVTMALMAVTGCVLPVDIVIGDDFHVRGSGHVIQEARAVPAFDGIEVSHAIEVRLVETGFEGVRVIAEDNLVPHLETRVRGGMLEIRFERGVSVSPRRAVVVEVDAYEVLELRASGASRIEADLAWSPERWVQMSGASSMRLYGAADRLHATLSGASRLAALDFETHRTDVDISGASVAHVWVTDRLDAHASGASHVRFIGWPEVRASVSGASSVAPY